MKRVYLQHNSRGDDSCPLCQSALRWRKSGTNKWTPCDHVPVMCCFTEAAVDRVLYKGEIITDVQIVRKENAAQFLRKQLFYALEPHVFTCQNSINRQKGLVNYMQMSTNSGNILVCGIVGNDAEFKTVGDTNTSLCKFSLKVGDKPNPDGSNKPIPIWCNCVAWKNIADRCKHFKKGDPVFAIGKIDTREYQGKVYKDLVLEFANAMSSEITAENCTTPKVELAPTRYFQEIKESDPDDLPF